MDSAIPKQFLAVNGKAILWHSVNAFAEAFDNITIIVVVPAAHEAQARQICNGFRDVVFTHGGVSRFQSVKNGLQHVKEPSIVFIHDAVRCLVTKDLLARCYRQAEEKGSAIPAVAVNDSLRVNEDGSHKVINRDNIVIIQTPQVFRSEIILPAFAVDDDPRFTDEATVVEASGGTVHLVEGEYTNLKITRPFDLQIAAAVLNERSALK
ncbi:MAG: 2-C-methyl-D-erythritol 4-phosphate cytidylyltransferase [Chitinophagaceae bacterium]|jgi:2-C-methyl-D-erythritol 4-phosphate cytidylyltransferase|nr:2-C-methyl-D-erythritol 4-phosphate cytidylyltransferase [Chitinophagaceae bacterium]